MRARGGGLTSVLFPSLGNLNNNMAPGVGKFDRNSKFCGQLDNLTAGASGSHIGFSHVVVMSFDL